MWDVNVRLKMEDQKYEANYFSADEHFIETRGLDLIAGRNFPENMSGENEIDGDFLDGRIKYYHTFFEDVRLGLTDYTTFSKLRIAHLSVK